MVEAFTLLEYSFFEIKTQNNRKSKLILNQENLLKKLCTNTLNLFNIQIVIIE